MTDFPIFPVTAILVNKCLTFMRMQDIFRGLRSGRGTQTRGSLSMLVGVLSGRGVRGMIAVLGRIGG